MEILFLATQETSTSWLFSFFQQIQTVEAVILIIGLLLLVAEMFMPGFGIAGGTGIVLIIAGIFMTARSALEAFIMFVVLILLVTGMMLLILRSAKKGQIARRLILHQSASREKGFRTSRDLSHLVGQTGIAATSLRPAGTGLFDGNRLDVVTEGSFIEKDTPIQITQTHGSRIIVVPYAKASNK